MFILKAQITASLAELVVRLPIASPPSGQSITWSAVQKGSYQRLNQIATGVGMVAYREGLLSFSGSP